MIKTLVRLILRLFYRVEIKGLQHFQQACDRVLIVSNHTSFLDGLILGAFLPGKLSFAINTHIAQRWFSRLIKPIVKLFVLDPTNPLSLKSLIRYMQGNEKVVIFPEGRITVTGSLMKIYNGPGLVADRSDATVLPIRIDGAQYTPFSRLRGRVRLRWFPKISLTILPARKISAPDEVRGRERRKYAGKALTDIMTDMMFATGNPHRTLFESVLDAQRIHGSNHLVVEDIERQPMTYRQILTRAFIVGNKIHEYHEHGEYVGIFLPNSTGTMSVFLGLQIYGQVPAMLNFTAGARGMLQACETARIKTVYTSRRFIQAGRLQSTVDQLATKVNIIYLDDLVPTVTIFDKLRGLFNALTARLAYKTKSGHTKPADPAVLLFTSGSEGSPKGVVLSHENILVNALQLSTKIDFSSQDIIFNALPMFHSFGLTAGSLLPLISGMRVFFYPTPLHYRIVPEMAYEVNATILFGTNTFLKGYARYAHPYDFYSVRYVFAGAEKVQTDTRQIWSERFGIRILEGYGATETSPVLATNTPMEIKSGTVGQFLPGVEYQLLPVPGVEKGGKLLVKGPNVMLGYLLHDKPGVIVPPQTEQGAGWYDTGDIVEIDDEGFVTICGRAKRFAKIGGEMVSLGAVEEIIGKCWPGHHHAIVAIPDSSKGEQLVLLTSYPDADRKLLVELMRAHDVSEINIPRKIIRLDNVPLLGSGKTDYTSAYQIALAS